MSGNVARNGAGVNTGAPSTFTNVTFSGNAAEDSGGGLNTFNAPHVLNNVTLTGNTADSDADSAGDGGGLATDGGTQDLRNTVVAGNTDASPGAETPDCEGGLVSLGHNLIGNTAGCSFTDATGDITNVSAGLGPLAANGGLTHDPRAARRQPRPEQGRQRRLRGQTSAASRARWTSPATSAPTSASSAARLRSTGSAPRVPTS